MGQFINDVKNRILGRFYETDTDTISLTLITEKPPRVKKEIRYEELYNIDADTENDVLTPKNNK